MEPERYIAYLKEKNVNIPDEDAAVFFRLAVIENDKAARERIKRPPKAKKSQTRAASNILPHARKKACGERSESDEFRQAAYNFL